MEKLVDEEKCKRCGCKLYADDSKKAGYCGTCASQDENARKVWEEKGLAKFCLKCGQMLYTEASIITRICTVCRVFKTEKKEI